MEFSFSCLHNQSFIDDLWCKHSHIYFFWILKQNVPQPFFEKKFSPKIKFKPLTPNMPFKLFQYLQYQDFAFKHHLHTSALRAYPNNKGGGNPGFPPPIVDRTTASFHYKTKRCKEAGFCFSQTENYILFIFWEEIMYIACPKALEGNIKGMESRMLSKI